MKTILLALVALFSVASANARTLIVYYSFTNNVHRIVTDLQAQTGADMVRIQPAQEGLDYAANGYALGSALIQAIRNNPNSAASYPEIKPVDVNLGDYDMVIVAAPLWWSNMAAPLQTYLFHNGAAMAGKKIGLIVSSASSSISGVEADAKRLIPNGDFVAPRLWIRSSQTSSCHSMIADWLSRIDYNNISGIEKVVAPEMPLLHVTSEKIKVEGEFDSLSIYNLSGERLLRTSDSELPVSRLSPGIYVATVTANGHSRSTTIKL